jgi:hypothetical protein
MREEWLKCTYEAVVIAGENLVLRVGMIYEVM